MTRLQVNSTCDTDPTSRLTLHIAAVQMVTKVNCALGIDEGGRVS